MKPPKRLAWILLVSLAIAPLCAGESFLLVGEEKINSVSQVQPLASVEGIMSAVFDDGQIIFDTGALEVEVDWGARGFAEPLALAVQGRADFVMAALIDSRIDDKAAALPLISSRASFYLIDTASRELAASGELELSNLGREEEMPYAALQYQLGMEIGRRLLELWRQGRGPD